LLSEDTTWEREQAGERLNSSLTLEDQATRVLLQVCDLSCLLASLLKAVQSPVYLVISMVFRMKLVSFEKKGKNGRLSLLSQKVFQDDGNGQLTARYVRYLVASVILICMEFT
jgi:hypothetical protein